MEMLLFLLNSNIFLRLNYLIDYKNLVMMKIFIQSKVDVLFYQYIVILKCNFLIKLYLLMKRSVIVKDNLISNLNN